MTDDLPDERPESADDSDLNDLFDNENESEAADGGSRQREQEHSGPMTGGSTVLEEEPPVEDGDGDDPEEDEFDDLVELPPPDLKTTRWGPLGELWKLRKSRRKRQRLAAKGYVQWYLIKNTFPQPKYIQPEDQGGGIWEYKHNGERYLFPKEAMLPSEQQGMWTVVHKAGEADPINLDDPTKHSIPAQVLEEYLHMRPSSSAPSFLDRFDIDADDAIKYAIAGIIVFAVLNSVLGGGF